MEENHQPMAHALYVCKECKADYMKFYELYSSAQTDTKFCAVCRTITLHDRILPDDDNVKHYQKPNLLPVTKRQELPPRPF